MARLLSHYESEPAAADGVNYWNLFVRADVVSN